MPPKNKSVGQTPEVGQTPPLPKITGYKIVHAFLLSELERVVGELVSQGWIPSGGIVHVPKGRPGGYDPLNGFYQPLVKEG